ncbi:MAG: hypothetical protein M0P66_07720 [Salinivirgaceae bacterium]|nr:hypothetical protein [Salinivirgaceae bacterium]
MDEWLKYAEFFTNIITSVGILLGGMWAYRKFNVRNEGQWNANFKVSTETLQTGNDENIVSVVITIENIGDKKITPTPKGLTVQLFKAGNDTAAFGLIDKWEPISETEKDILAVYKGAEKDYTHVWSLDSRATYTERALLKIKDKGLYQLKCRLHIIDKKMPDDENCITEYVYLQL